MGSLSLLIGIVIVVSVAYNSAIFSVRFILVIVDSLLFLVVALVSFTKYCSFPTIIHQLRLKTYGVVNQIITAVIGTCGYAISVGIVYFDTDQRNLVSKHVSI